MSAHDHHPVSVDPEALNQAKNIWSGFTGMMKYSVIGIVILLAAMAVFLT